MNRLVSQDLLKTKDYLKTRDTIRSCQTIEQLDAAKRMLFLFKTKNPKLTHQYLWLWEYYMDTTNKVWSVSNAKELQTV